VILAGHAKYGRPYAEVSSILNNNEIWDSGSILGEMKLVKCVLAN